MVVILRFGNDAYFYVIVTQEVTEILQQMECYINGRNKVELLALDL